MTVDHVRIDGFKNLKEIEFDPDERYNIIVGKNAQGKTNLIEAIWILSGCKSFRGSKEKDYICLDGANMISEIVFKDSVRRQNISFRMSKTGTVPKSLFLNGVKLRGSKGLFEVFKCIAFTPDDVDIVKGSPEKRRVFIDMAASQINIGMVSHVTKNNIITEQRNALLKQILQGESSGDALEVWDRQAAAEGSVISYMRNEYVGRINDICAGLYGTISGGTEKLEIEYRSNIYRPEDFNYPCGAEAVEKYYKKLRESSEYDIKTGCTHSGVNRDEILIKLNGVSARDFGSQGQIKSIALVMKLAQAEIFMKKSKDPPVILLDDVMGELDESRQKFIFDIIKDMQVFITVCNENSVLPDISGKVFRISGGKIIGGV